MEAGDVVSVIGASGSGKTTLLRCVNLLEEFHAGRIVIDGQDIGYMDRNRRRTRRPGKEIARHRAMTGMAFQQFNLFPHMTALKNVTLGLIKVKKLPQDEAIGIADRWLKRVGLFDHRNRFPGQLSVIREWARRLGYRPEEERALRPVMTDRVGGIQAAQRLGTTV